MTYPDTPRGDVVDTYFGARIADPYRWLEHDPRRDAKVGAWMRAQDAHARRYLAALPGRDAFHKRVTALLDHERLTAPQKAGNRYLFTRNTGLDRQPVLVVREGANGAERVLLDPNTLSKDGSQAIGEWIASHDGTRVALALQDGGTDWRTIRVIDAGTGKFLDDKLGRVRFSTIAWRKDGSGFFYSRYPDAGAAAGERMGHAVHFHALGTPQSQDRLVYSTPDQPHMAHVADVTDDGRYALIYTTQGSGSNGLAVIDLMTEAWTPRVLVADQAHQWTVIGNKGSTLFLNTQQGAQRGKLVTLDLADPHARFTDLVAEQKAVLRDASLVGDRLLVAYLVDATTQIKRYRLDGSPDGELALPIGSAGGFRGSATDDEAFFVFTGYDTPTTIYRYDVARNRKTVWAEPKTAVDLERTVVEQRFYASKDGTRVPLFVIRRKDITAPAPTILYGYGGFGINLLPQYSAAHMAWVEQGGVYAVANLRGGSEYGKAWHDGGRLAKKQNTFDDFIAAAEYLKAEGIAAPDGLAIQGESNGGLLVGAVTNQRPDLFAAALPGVGVMDMLRFPHLAGGKLGFADYGDPADPAAFATLRRYSPLHNIRGGRQYPAMLVTTADRDDRVAPAHSFKYAAALQHADLGPRPRLLRVDTRAGHGTGKPIDQAIDELADMWAFAARWTGLDVSATP